MGVRDRTLEVADRGGWYDVRDGRILGEYEHPISASSAGGHPTAC